MSVGLFFFFFFNDTATTEIYTLSLHDALPICSTSLANGRAASTASTHCRAPQQRSSAARADRKSTRLNSSHSQISYAVFCLKKKNTQSAYLSVRVKFLTMSLPHDRHTNSPGSN